MYEVRGLAVEARGIGKSELFRTYGISLETLKMVPKLCPDRKRVEKKSRKSSDNESRKNCCRYPCDNCRRIFSLFGLKAELPNAPYDKDMDAADVSPH